MNNDINLSNIFNLAKLFTSNSSGSTSNIKNNSTSTSWTLSPIDSHIHTESLRVCKCIIPYLSIENQKNLSILVKAVELVSVMNYFSDLESDSAEVVNYRSHDNWQMDLLNNIKSNLNPENAFWVDVLLKFKDAKEIIAMKGPENVQGDDSQKDFLADISPKLNDNQNQLLDMLSKVMK